MSKQTAKRFFLGLGIVGVLSLCADVFGVINFLTGWNLPALIHLAAADRRPPTPAPGATSAGPSGRAPTPPPSTPAGSDSPGSDSPGTDMPSPDSSEVAPSAPQPVYLAQLQADHIDDKSGTGTAEPDVGHVNGRVYGHSIIMNPGCQNDDGGDMWAEYDLGRKYTYLKVTVGSSEKDPADSKFRYTVLADGRKLTSGTVTKLRTASLNVKVQGHLTLRLMISDPQAPDRSCGFSNAYRFVWGDAQLVP